jgi:hypothetical protein
MLSWKDVEFPASGGEAHIISSPRKEGEAYLAHLAQISDREYAWEYNADQEEWSYVPASDLILEEKRSTNGVTTRRVGLTVPFGLFFPSGSESTIYHIHPRWAYADLQGEHVASLQLKNQIPSGNDIGASIVLTQNGYRDFRIVTELGVTSLKYSDTAIASGNEKERELPRYSAKLEWIAGLLVGRGLHGAIEDVMADMNNTYAGQITLKYEKF